MVLLPQSLSDALSYFVLIGFFAGVAGRAASVGSGGAAGIKVDGDHIDFLAGGQLVTRYHFGPDVAKPYFWPIIGPAGISLTRSWPMEAAKPAGSTDHPHQRSAWFGHGDVIPEGIELKDKIKGARGVDFWSEAAGHGRIECTKVGAPSIDQDHAAIATHNDWLTANHVKILGEERVIRLFVFGGTRLLVIEADLSAVVPLTFGDTKEGAFGIRINDSLRASKGGRIENAEGKVGEFACWGQHSAWCDYSGVIAGHAAGVAILDDPSNRAQACWHCRGYGLMAANPFGRSKAGFPAVAGKGDLVRLARGEHLKLRYGLLIHPGNARDGQVAEYYRRFIDHKGTKNAKEDEEKKKRNK